jgi:predicted DNA-binding transcriptional regulator AlpA
MTRAKQPREKPPAAVPAGVNALLSRAQVLAALGGISERQLAYMLAKGEFPKHDCSIGRRPMWTTALINGWIAEQANARRP